VLISNDGAGARQLVGAKNSPARWFDGVVRRMTGNGQANESAAHESGESAAQEAAEKT